MRQDPTGVVMAPVVGAGPWAGVSLGRAEGPPLEAVSSLVPPGGSPASEAFTPQIQQHVQSCTPVGVVGDLKMLAATQRPSTGGQLSGLWKSRQWDATQL